jgi:sugar fermentation stimulation protein A
MESSQGAQPVYRFPKPLEEGLVLARPNRFIMTVRARGRTIRCHCPTTGRLGDLRIADIPCLFSRASGDARKTRGTVEAISLDPPEKQRKSWVGINQTAANRYIEFFLRAGSMPEIASGPVRREVRLGASRIDFLVGSTYVEVKTPLIILPLAAGAKREGHSRFDSFDRLIKHMGELGSALREGNRAAILMCYLYDAEPFKPPPMDSHNAPVILAAKRATELGVERWQVNLRVEADGVRMLRYFRNG